MSRRNPLAVVSLAENLTISPCSIDLSRGETRFIAEAGREHPPPCNRSQAGDWLILLPTKRYSVPEASTGETERTGKISAASLAVVFRHALLIHERRESSFLLVPLASADARNSPHNAEPDRRLPCA